MGFFRILVFASVCMFPLLTSANVSTLVADTKSGLILSSKNATVQQYPASLTKVMTLYLTFSAIDKGILKMDDRLPVSLKAARQPRSKLYVRAGQTISVKDAIMALIIISANDVAVVLAEALAPSEAEFAEMMTETAKSLGLKNTTFKNASGLHNKDQVTTAQDMAILAMAMIHHFPHHYKLFSKRNFVYKGRTYRSHNHVQKKYKGAEGLKTGYISAVGYNIISTAKRNDNRLVSVVIGQDTVALRDRQAMRLLDRGFSRIKKQKTTSSGNQLLNKQAILDKPDMTPFLKIMAERLDQVVKTNKHIDRSKLLALNPFASKTAIAAETYIENTPFLVEEKSQDMIKVKDVLIEQGSNIKAEEEAEQKQSEDMVADLDKKIENENSVVLENNVAQNVIEPEEKTQTESRKSVSDENIVKINQLNFATPSQHIENKPKGWGVQVGAFATKEKAYAQSEKVLKILNIRNKQILTPSNNAFYRSRIYGFYSKKAAQNICRKLKRKKMDCMVISKEN